MVKSFFKTLTVSSVAVALSACSGSSGGGGGAASSSLLQVSKMTCNGSNCIGTGSSSFLPANLLAAATEQEEAIQLYNTFNTDMIPALNSIIAKVEEGVKKGGAESCDDIELDFSGTLAISGTSYDVKTGAPAQSAPNYFSAQTMTKGLAGKLTGGDPFLQGDVYCGEGTDASPLVARVIANNGTQQLNAWFEKGDSKHIRVLMVVAANNKIYGAWFKTDDGDSFELILASQGSVYKAVGKKSLERILFGNYSPGLMAVPESCLNSTNGSTASSADCSSFASPGDITVTTIPASLATFLPTLNNVGNMSSELSWGDLVVDLVSMNQPNF